MHSGAGHARLQHACSRCSTAPRPLAPPAVFPRDANGCTDVGEMRTCNWTAIAGQASPGTTCTGRVCTGWVDKPAGDDRVLLISFPAAYTYNTTNPGAINQTETPTSTLSVRIWAGPFPATP